jgi:uncharacterized phage-associated protein
MEITLAQDKAFNALVYFAEKLKPLYLTKAIKLLYLADEMAIKESGVPVTWLNYKAWKFGPVPEDIFNKVKFAHNQRRLGIEQSPISQINVVPAPSNLPEGIVLEPARAFDDSQFSDYEVEILDKVISTYGKYNAEQLVEILHKEDSLWHSIVEKNNLQQQFELKNNRSDYIIELTHLLDSDFKKSAFEVAYQSYLMQENLM